MGAVREDRLEEKLPHLVLGCTGLSGLSVEAHGRAETDQTRDVQLLFSGFCSSPVIHVHTHKRVREREADIVLM